MVASRLRLQFEATKLSAVEKRASRGEACLQKVARVPPRIARVQRHGRGVMTVSVMRMSGYQTEASCGIRAHDLPLTERVLCQLS